MIAEIETAIVERLTSLKDDQGLRVMAFPDKPDELGRAMPKGQVLVGFKRENLEPPAAARNLGTSTIQPWRLEFELSLQLKDLRSHAGAYEVIRKIRELLTGYHPAESDRCLYETNAEFVDLNEGIWFYAMTFAIDLVYLKKSWSN